MIMGDSYFEEIVEMDERPGEAYTKHVEDRTEYTGARNTDFKEEWEALKRTHQVLPDYVPQPVSATWNKEGDLQQYTMEEYDFDSRIEYALDNGFDSNTVRDAYSELEEVISVLHEHSNLVPHGDLIGNTFIVDGSPVLIDPKGIPQDQDEELEWMKEDQWQFKWLKDNGLRDL